jgi:hypothetical protein
MDMMMRCAVAFVSQSHEPSFVQTIFVEKQKKRDRKLALRDIFAEEPFLQTALSLPMFCTKLKRSLHTNTPSGIT